MPAEIIYDDDHLRAVHQAGTSDFSLVTFGGLTHRPDGTSFWGQRPAAKLGLDAVGILAKSPNWYPQSAMQRCLPAVTARLRQRRVGYGFSMGGYAALKYGRGLGLTHALAVSPQVSIDPADVPEDPRYHPRFRPALNGGMRVSAADVTGFAVQVVDPYFRYDLAQAALIAAIGGVETLALPFMGHGTIEHFADTDMLRRTLEALLAGDLARLRSLLRGQRRRSLGWHRLVGREAMQRGHDHLAERLWHQAQQLGAPPAVIQMDRAAGLEMRVRLLALRQRPGDAERAEALARDAMTAAPEDGPMLARLAVWLLRCGRPAAALPLLRRAIALDADLGSAHRLLGTALWRLGQREEALAVARTAAARWPQDSQIALCLGQFLAMARDSTGAEAALRTALSAPAVASAAALSLSQILARQGRSAEALDVLQEAIAIVLPAARLPLLERVRQLRAGGAEASHQP